MDHERFLRSFLGEEMLLRAFLLAATGDRHVADDLLQSVATVLWEKIGQYDESKPFRAWALGVARLEVLKWRQKLARKREVLSENALECAAGAAEHLAEEIDRRHDFLRDCLEQVEGMARRVLDLKYVEGLVSREIAPRVGKSVEAVEMTLVRVRRALHDCVDRKLAQESRGPS